MTLNTSAFGKWWNRSPRYPCLRPCIRFVCVPLPAYDFFIREKYVQSFILSQQTNSTLIEWVSIFSNDASQEVLQDSKYKKRDGFQLLLKYLENNLAKSATGGLKRERSQSPGKRTPAKK